MSEYSRKATKFQRVLLYIIGGIFLTVGAAMIVFAALGSFTEPVMVNHHQLILPYLGVLLFYLGIQIGKDED